MKLKLDLPNKIVELHEEGRLCVAKKESPPGKVVCEIVIPMNKNILFSLAEGWASEGYKVDVIG